MTIKEALAWALAPQRVQAFQDWRRQPTTVAGIATITGAIGAWATGGMTARQAVFGVLGGVVAMVLPDNANRKISLVPDAVAGAQPPPTVSVPMPGKVS